MNIKINTILQPQVEPFYDKNEILIFIGSSEYFAAYVGVLVWSIACNASAENNYDIVILADGITDETKQLMQSQKFINNNVALRFLDVGALLETHVFHPKSNVSRISCARLLIPELAPTVDKAIWIDGDTVVNRDVAELFAIDMQDCFVGAVHDLGLQTWKSDLNWSPKELKRVLDVDVESYFNAGVLLLNLALLREFFTSQQMLDVAARTDIRFIDQDALNFLCKGRVCYIPAAWNVLVTSYPSDKVPPQLAKEVKEACTNPYIVHYVGSSKPADNPSLPFGHYFWKYARQTIFYETLLQRYIEATVYSALYRKKVSFRGIVKRLLMPMFNLIFPKGSKGRKDFANWFYRLRA